MPVITVLSARRFDEAKNGERCSAAAAYLHPVMDERPNLTVITKARATKINFEGMRSVSFTKRAGDCLN